MLAICLAFKYNRLGEMLGLCIVVGRVGPFGGKEINLKFEISAPFCFEENMGFGDGGAFVLPLALFGPLGANKNI